MSREDSAGLNARNHYGPRTLSAGEDGGKYFAQFGDNAKAEWVINYADANASGALTAARDYNGVKSLPANSYIASASLQVIEAFDSAGDGATLTLGLVEADGTAIDPDGIDAAVAQSALDAVGETVLCNGALVEALAGIGAADGQLIASNGTEAFTAGKAVLTIEYRKPSVRA